MIKVILIVLLVAACAPENKPVVKPAPAQKSADEICTSENPIPLLSASEENSLVFAACNGVIREIGEAPHNNAPGDLPDNPKGLKYISIACENNIDVDIYFVMPREGLKAGDSVKQADIIGRVGRRRDSKGNYVATIMYDNNRKLYIDPLQRLYPKHPKAKGCDKLGSARL